MIKFIKYINLTFEDESALYDETRGVIVKKGDSYHDKMNEWIEGFLGGIRYLSEEYDVQLFGINPSDDMFEKLDFYNEED